MPRRRRGGSNDPEGMFVTFVVFSIALGISVYFYVYPMSAQGKQIALGFMIVCAIAVGGFILQPLLNMLPDPDDD
jgi:Na+/melibiose symporter-like transporter